MQMDQNGRQPRAPGQRSSLPIARVAGVTIRVHWSFLLLVAFVVAASWSAGVTAVVELLAWIAALFASVVVHELGHSIVARRRGANVLGILLLPIGGMSQIDKMPERPSDELAIAIVGPLTSLALGIVLLVVAEGTGAAAWPPTLMAGSWWARLGWLNLLLAGFNLLPALPMDGGRVLRAWLERRRDPLTATRLAGRIARWIAVAMLVAGLFYDFWLIFIGIFVLLGASAEEQEAARSRALRTLAPRHDPGFGGAGPAPWSPPQGAPWPVPGYPPPTLPPPRLPPPGLHPGAGGLPPVGSEPPGGQPGAGALPPERTLHRDRRQPHW